jgi:WD40 repeat protein/serine/threonine protein kinase
VSGTNEPSLSDPKFRPEGEVTRTGGYNPPQPGGALTLTGGIDPGKALAALSTPMQAGAADIPVASGTMPQQAALGRDWKVGDVIDGKYEVKGHLGKGGMGVVYRVHHREWKIDLAVKTPTAEMVGNAAGRSRFIREANTWVDLGLHPNIVQCWYVRELDGIPRLFLDLVSGGTLKDWMTDGKIKPDQLDLILDLMIQASEGLRHAHENGLVHRDVKPANFLVNADNELLVTDFGLVRQVSEAELFQEESPNTPVAAGSTLTMTGASMGTPEYGAPEQWGDAGAADHRADIYALGMTIYELCCGRRAFDDGAHREPSSAIIARHLTVPAPDPRSHRPDIPAALAEVILDCLEKDPQRRPESMRELRDRLVAIYVSVTGKPYPRPEARAADLRSDALNNKAVSLWDLGNRELALAAWREALKLDPHQLQAQYNMALVEWRSGLIDADLIVARLREEKGQNCRSNLYLGFFLLEQLSTAESQNFLANALEDPEIAADATAWRSLGHALLSQESYEDAEEAYSEALARQTDDAQALKCRELARSKQRTFPEGTVFPGPIQLSEPGTSSGLRAVATAADGNTVAAATLAGVSVNTKLLVWKLPEQAPQLVLHPKAGVTCLAITPDGELLFSAGMQGILQVWSLETGGCRRSFHEEGFVATAVAVTPDGSIGLAAGSDTHLRLWVLHDMDIPGASFRTLYTGHTGVVHCVTTTPDARLGVSGSDDLTVRLWDLSGRGRGGSKMPSWHVLNGHTDSVQVVQVSPDGKLLVSGSEDKTIRVWSLPAGKPLWTLKGHTGGIEGLTISQDGLRAVSGSRDHTVRVWDLTTGTCLQVLEGLDLVRGLALGATGKLLGHNSRSLVQVDMRSDRDLVRAPLVCVRGRRHREVEAAQERFRGLLDQAQTVFTSGDASLALVFLQTARSIPGYERDPSALSLGARITRSLTPRRLMDCWFRKVIGYHPRRVTGVVLTHDAQQVLTSSEDQTLRLWDVETGGLVRTFNGHTKGVFAVCLVGSRQAVLSGSEDQSVRLWDLESGESKLTLTGHTGGVHAVACSPDGRRAITGGPHENMRIWDLQNGRCLHALREPAGALAMRPDGRTAVSASRNTVVLWDLESGTAIRRFAGHSGPVRSLALTPDGRLALSGGDDHSVRLWDLEGGVNQLEIFLLHEAPVVSVTTTPDGRLALSGDQVGIIHQWELATCKKQRSLEEGSPMVCALAVSQDGRTLMTGSRQLKYWELDWEYVTRA